MNSLKRNGAARRVRKQPPRAAHDDGRLDGWVTELKRWGASLGLLHERLTEPGRDAVPALTPDGRLLIHGGDPLREIPVDGA
jgi:hypothetical protein